MTPISIFLTWPDSILNKLDPLSYTAVHKSELRDDLVWTPHTTQTQITLMFPKALSHGGWESLGRVGHGQKEELYLLLPNKLPASAGPCFSYLLFTLPYLVFCWSPCPACHPSRQDSSMSLLHHEALWSRCASSQQLQSDCFMRWDAEWRCFGNSRGQFESDLWAAGPCRALFLRTPHWVSWSLSPPWL